MLRLLCWNICSGPVDAQIAHLAASHADLLVLTEYRRLNPSVLPSPPLAAAGWAHQYTPVTTWGPRGVMIASREEIEVLPASDTLDLGAHTDELLPCVALVRLPQRDLTVIGVYMPHEEGLAKGALWQALNHYAAAQRDGRVVIAGDLNSCAVMDAESHLPSSPEPLEMLGAHVTDAWQAAGGEEREPSDRYTWYWHGEHRRLGRRLDYVFLSHPLALTLLDARHDHDVRERGLSDHSALVVDLAGAGRS